MTDLRRDRLAIDKPESREDLPNISELFSESGQDRGGAPGSSPDFPMVHHR